ncbi:MAG: hypothetical protein GX238_10810 [Epulopiscium sp.]|nr:hypothetical protein [Candidatus Epulonipiscium sp.]
MEKESSIELQQLIQLTQKFLDFTKSLLERGNITEEQYIQMTEHKIRFLEDIYPRVKG